MFLKLYCLIQFPGGEVANQGLIQWFDSGNQPQPQGFALVSAPSNTSLDNLKSVPNEVT